MAVCFYTRIRLNVSGSVRMRTPTKHHICCSQPTAGSLRPQATFDLFSVAQGARCHEKCTPLRPFAAVGTFGLVAVTCTLVAMLHEVPVLSNMLSQFDSQIVHIGLLVGAQRARQQARPITAC